MVDVEPGTSLLEAANQASVPMGDACGGNCARSTCHVYVREGFDSLEEMSDEEDDILGRADAVEMESRLGVRPRSPTSLWWFRSLAKGRSRSSMSILSIGTGSATLTSELRVDTHDP